jgi:hypothetical protein
MIEMFYRCELIITLLDVIIFRNKKGQVGQEMEKELIEEILKESGVENLENLIRVLGTRDLVAEINQTPVLTEDLLNLIQEVHESPPESRDWEGRAITAVVLFAGTTPHKAKAVMFRVEALARLLDAEGAPGWTLPLPNGALLTQEAVFAAAAAEPLIEHEGEVAFDRQKFLARVLEMADLDQIG